MGDYIYNWPVSQWAAVARVDFGSEGYAKAGIFDSNTDYLSTKPNPALWPTFPDDSQGVILPAEAAWTRKFNGLAASYQIGGWWNNSAAPNVATSIDGEPVPSIRVAWGSWPRALWVFHRVAATTRS